MRDGAQQRLLSIGLALQLARKEVCDVSQAAELLDESGSELEAAIGELRNLAAGIHLTVLVERRLGARSDPLARRLALPVEVSGITAGRLAAPVETTAYLLICEVLQNTVKHAQAAGPGSASCRRMGSSRLRSATTGSAALIRQRAGAARARRLVEAVGGRLSIESPSSGGTTVRVGAAMRVVIADDALLIREGLTRALAGCSRRQPLSIWDIRGKNALSAMRRLYI